ncbi:helix-turn-helix domain-containing protein [Zoogloea sp. LCSB751]|uniref:MerR family transcriptional regulator n=1 Tax=Zoogloea sp. LCSB751 TaxID=1965277 RepID=UPI0009A4EC79|nr:helix-turn-helix domain-containing protein [Zoogloea sp. LCSB751]
MTAETISTQTCSTRDAAHLLGISVRTAQLWVEEGRLQAWKTPGGHRRILVESVDRLLLEQRCAGIHTAVPFGMLLVMDDEAERNALQGLLGKLLPDCLVTSTSCPCDGLLRVGEMAPEIFVVDWRVGGLDAGRIAHALLGRVRRQPMLVVVLVESDREREEAQERLPGAAVLVDVPVDGDGLAAIVRTFLGIGGRRRRPSATRRPEAVQ